MARPSTSFISSDSAFCSASKLREHVGELGEPLDDRDVRLLERARPRRPAASPACGVWPSARSRSRRFARRARRGRRTRRPAACRRRTPPLRTVPSASMRDLAVAELRSARRRPAPDGRPSVRASMPSAPRDELAVARVARRRRRVCTTKKPVAFDRDVEVAAGRRDRARRAVEPAAAGGRRRSPTAARRRSSARSARRGRVALGLVADRADVGDVGRRGDRAASSRARIPLSAM